MKNIILFIVSFLISISSFSQAENKEQSDSLSSSYATKSVRNYCKVIGWKGETPKAPEGFVVEKFAVGFENPRWMYITPNGDILVAEKGIADDISNTIWRVRSVK